MGIVSVKLFLPDGVSFCCQAINPIDKAIIKNAGNQYNGLIGFDFIFFVFLVKKQFGGFTYQIYD
ncbi:MAG: hypothetical protein C4308_12890 [Chitinophagaceae bacterium]